MKDENTPLLSESERYLKEQANLKSPPHPETIGKYRIIRSIGRGGMGEVFLAADPDLERHVVVKRIDPEFSHKQQYRMRFIKEARAVAEITHPNIVEIYDFHPDPDELFIVMEFVTGGDLYSKLRKHGRVEITEAIGIIKALTGALNATYTEGIVHRDIKPRNILLTDTGQPKLTDFGVAKKLIDETTSLTLSGHSPGTPDYMAPEQVTGKNVDIRSDIYSLGITFYEMITGDQAFKDIAYTAIEKRAQHIESKLDHFVKEIPESTNTSLGAMLSVIAKMTDINPDKRFQTPRELLNELARLDDAAAVIPNRKSRTTRRLTIFIVAAVCFGLIMLAMRMIPTPSREISTHDHNPAIHKADGMRSDSVIEIRTRIQRLAESLNGRQLKPDYWTSPPIILTFGRHDDNTSNALLKELQKRLPYPVVDRTRLSETIGELELVANDMTDRRLGFAMGTLMPGTLFIDIRTIAENDRTVFQVKLIKVMTSEVLAFIEESVTIDDPVRRAYISLCNKIGNVLRNRFPAKGRVISVDENEITINIGSLHGIRETQMFDIHEEIPDPSISFLKRNEPVASAELVAADNLKAVLRIINKNSTVTTNMLVVDAGPEH